MNEFEELSKLICENIFYKFIDSYLYKKNHKFIYSILILLSFE